LVKSLFSEARIILKWDRHVSTKTRHSIEVHLRFSNNLRNIKVELQVHQFILWWAIALSNRFFSIFSWFTTFWYRFPTFRNLLLLNDLECIMRQALPRFQDLSNHVLMILWCGMNVLNNFGSFTVNMRAVVVFVLNFKSWMFKLSNIHASCTGELVQEMSQLL
jgi:hypothetical protein